MFGLFLDTSLGSISGLEITAVTFCWFWEHFTCYILHFYIFRYFQIWLSSLFYDWTNWHTIFQSDISFDDFIYSSNRKADLKNIFSYLSFKANSWTSLEVGCHLKWTYFSSSSCRAHVCAVTKTHNTYYVQHLTRISYDNYRTCCKRKWRVCTSRCLRYR